jgi:valyl-tRNA synthetase
MRMDELARPAIDAVASGRVRIHPEGQRQVYLDWMENIRPWCISRQLWWGHQIPVWYRDEETYVGTSAPEGEGWERDPDVLDTWFSSALWPFATLGWPDETPALDAFYPTDALVTARDIIFLWVARMVMMGLEFTGRDPFSDVYITSVIQGLDGKPMSKSRGNGIDPVDEIAKHGADAVRFGLLAMSSSQDVRYAPDKVAQGQALANKLFNAARFVLTRVTPGVDAAATPTAIEDRWILSRLQAVKEQTSAHIEAFEFHLAALGLYDFVYSELCDHYVELVKPRLTAEEGAEEVSATLLHVLSETVALAHPVIPFVTEEIWSHLPGSEGLLAGAAFPPPDAGLVDRDAEARMAQVVEAVSLLRGWRDTAGARPGMSIAGRLEASGYEGVEDSLAHLARFDFVADGGDPVAIVPIPGGAVAVLATEGLDLEAASRRTDAERARIEAEIARAAAKLANEGFVDKAPPDVVQAERDKLERLQAELESL